MHERGNAEGTLDDWGIGDAAQSPSLFCPEESVYNKNRR